MSDPVELRAAFEWTCDDCGRDNFARAVTLSPEQVSEHVPTETLAMAEALQGDWCIAPRRVTCEHCGVSRETQDWPGGPEP